jgi:cysteine-rich repeat protein
MVKGNHTAITAIWPIFTRTYYEDSSILLVTVPTNTSQETLRDINDRLALLQATQTNVIIIVPPSETHSMEAEYTARMASLSLSNTGVSDFWLRANRTTRLSELRAPTRSRHAQRTNADPLIVQSPPVLLPLCGNGRIDTRADYDAYYSNARAGTAPLLLRMMRSRIFNMPDSPYPNPYQPHEEVQQMSLGARAAYDASMAAYQEAHRLYNLTVLPHEGEVCDDGNRLDFDGCSADCMALDLWAPACELAVVVAAPPSSTITTVSSSALEYEGLVYDPFRKAMVVSAADGLYRLDMASDTAPALTATRIVSKKVRLAGLARLQNALLLYQAVPTVVLHALIDGESEVRELWRTGIVNSSARWPLIAPDPPSPLGDVVFRSRTSLHIVRINPVDTTALIPFGCFVGERIADEDCAIYGSAPSGALNIRCGGWLSITIGYPSLCEIHTSALTPSFMTDWSASSLWSDVIDSISALGASVRIDPSGLDISAAPAINELIALTLRAYHPMAGFIEVMVGAPPRKWGENTSSLEGSGDASPLVYAQANGGEPFVDMIMNTGRMRTCGLDHCLFDNKVQFDPLAGPTDEAPPAAAVGETWNDLLQSQLDALRPPLTSLYALKSDAARYTAFLKGFAEAYLDQTAATRVLASAVYPESGSLWALHGNGKRLVEISKLGTLVRSPLDPSKCVPSGVGLCDPCMWGVAGRGCRNCAAAPGSDDSALMRRAHRTSCRACAGRTAPPPPGARRRLLATAETLLQFAVVGDRAAIVALWPNASTADADGLVRVTVSTPTPIETMRALKAQLLALPQLRVVVPPYAAIDLEASTGKPAAEEEGLGAGVIAAIVLSSLVLVAVLLALCVCVMREHKLGSRSPDDSAVEVPLLQPARRTVAPP